MTNPTYIITKREKCEHDPATFVDINASYTRPSVYLGAVYTVPNYTKGCPICGIKGYVDTEVDLIDVLKRVANDG